MHGSQTTVEDARWIWHLAGRDESSFKSDSGHLEGGDDAATKVRAPLVHSGRRRSRVKGAANSVGDGIRVAAKNSAPKCTTSLRSAVHF